MKRKLTVLGLSFCTFILSLLIGCTPQTAEEAPLTIPTIRVDVPTIRPTEPAPELPTAVAVAATQTPRPTETTAPPPTEKPPTETPTPTETAEAAKPAADEDDRLTTNLYTVVGVESDDVLNVRDGAGVDNEIVGELPYNGVGIELLGEDVLINSSAWREVRYEEITGWVNRAFLAKQYGELHDSAAAASELVLALKSGDYATISTYVHPTKGVRISPNTYVTDEHIVFNAAAVANLASDDAIYTWGITDGEGGPIALTFTDYNERYLYNADYFRPHSIGFNTFIGSGNRINNITEVYPDAVFVEYHFPGFEPDFGGLDWTSLRLIMEEVDGEWKLVGIVHSEWTI